MTPWSKWVSSTGAGPIALNSETSLTHTMWTWVVYWDLDSVLLQSCNNVSHPDLPLTGNTQPRYSSHHLGFRQDDFLGGISLMCVRQGLRGQMSFRNLPHLQLCVCWWRLLWEWGRTRRFNFHLSQENISPRHHDSPALFCVSDIRYSLSSPHPLDLFLALINMVAGQRVMLL